MSDLDPNVKDMTPVVPAHRSFLAVFALFLGLLSVCIFAFELDCFGRSLSGRPVVSDAIGKVAAVTALCSSTLGVALGVTSLLRRRHWIVATIGLLLNIPLFWLHLFVVV